MYEPAQRHQHRLQHLPLWDSMLVAEALALLLLPGSFALGPL